MNIPWKDNPPVVLLGPEAYKSSSVEYLEPLIHEVSSTLVDLS